MGHVHHTLALIYFEEARAAYWREVVGRDGLEHIDYMMGEVTVRYRQRIHFPGTLQVAVRTTRLGSKSFTMEYELRDAAGTLLVTGSSEQVMFDYESGSSKEIPADVRQRIEHFEGRAV
jgi:acyl-CoA thioester hydrolase